MHCHRLNFRIPSLQAVKAGVIYRDRFCRHGVSDRRAIGQSHPPIKVMIERFARTLHVFDVGAARIRRRL